MDALKDYYAVLGVLPLMEFDAIRAAYLALLKRNHPDVNQGNKGEAERRTKELNEAYDVLGHEQTRDEYDCRRARTDGRLRGYRHEIIHENPEHSIAEVASRWKYVSDYYREVHHLSVDLEKMSSNLTMDYQVALFENKVVRTNIARKIADLMKREFTYRRSGGNERITG